MADAVATVGVNLEDGVSSPAMAAAGALDKLRVGVDADNKALAAMERSMKNLQKGGVVNIQMYQDLKKKIDAKKQSIASAEASYIALGGTWDKTTRPGNKWSDMVEKMRGNADKLGGPLGQASGRLSFISKLMSSGGLTLGLTLAAAGFVALAVAAVAATTALLGYGIAAANAHRTELLQIEGMTKVRNWYGVAAGNAQEMQNAIDKVSGSVSVGRDKVAEYSAQLYKMHLRGENLTTALEAMSIAGSAAGDGQAQHFAGMAAAINMTGGSVKKLAGDVKARFGGVVARQMLDLTVQSKKLHESFSALFIGLNLEPLLKGVSMITSLFSQSTASGRALKTMLTVVLQPLIDGIAFAAPIVKRFFQGMVIGALAFTIAILKVRNWFKQTFDVQSLANFDLAKIALWAGVAAVTALGVAAAVTAVAVALVAAPFVLATAAVAGLVAATTWLQNVWEKTDWGALGSAIIDGIVGGIKGGAQWVTDAVSNLGNSAIASFKDALGIASPSKAFAAMGANIAQGAEQGVKSGTPSLQGAVEDMVSVPAAGARPAGGGNTNTFHVEINIDGAGKKAEEIGNELKRKIESMFEGVIIQLGVPA